MKKLTLEEHQSILYDILYKVDDFCKKYDIKYFLVGGSLLGAIRHKGIIPWDDDIDIGMERGEYERFISLFQNNLPKGYCLLCSNITMDFYCPFAKVGKIGTLLFEPNHFMPAKGIPINIDILPFDGCFGETKQEAVEYFYSYRVEMAKLFTWRFMKFSEASNYKEVLRIIKYNFKYPLKSTMQSFFSKAKQYSIKESNYFGCLAWGLYYEREVMPSSVLSTLIDCPFGIRDIPIPIGAKIYLESVYGDYMTPPPPEKRRMHSISGAFQVFTNNL